MGASALLAMALAGQSPAYAADAPVGLGTAAAYSVLGGMTVTNTGSTNLAGNLGVNPGSAITGFPPGHVDGAIHKGDAQALQARSDLTTAYDDAAGRPMTSLVAGDLADKTLSPGVYKSSGPLLVSGALTLDGQGDPNSVFIFQVASTLTTASASNIVLTNSAQACNVYWQVGSSATLGTASKFSGNILALTDISVTTNAEVQGRALARNGQVSLQADDFIMPGCATASPSSTPTATAPAPPSAAPATASPSAAAGPISAGPAPRTGRGVNIDTAAETHDSAAGTVLGAAAAAGLVGVWMLTGGRRLFRRNK
jgi:hypothetical protein